MTTSHTSRSNAGAIRAHKKISHSKFPAPNYKRSYQTLATIENSSMVQNLDRSIVDNRHVHDEEEIQIPDNNENVIKVGPSPLGLSSYLKMDVLSGRGGATNRHEGNVFFRDIVQVYRDQYLLAPKSAKSEISGTIVNMIRKRNGRFLKQNDSDGLWYEIGDESAREKTGQALRQKGTERRQQLWKEEAQKQRAARSRAQMHHRTYLESYMTNQRDGLQPMVNTEKSWANRSTMSTYKSEHFSFDDEHLAKYTSSKKGKSCDREYSPVPELHSEASMMMNHQPMYRENYYQEEGIGEYHRDHYFWEGQNQPYGKYSRVPQMMNHNRSYPNYSWEYPSDLSYSHPSNMNYPPRFARRSNRI